MALTIPAKEPAESFAAMKPPLYKPPLHRSVSSSSSSSSPESKSSSTKSSRLEGEDNHSLFHRSASLDTAGVFNRHCSPDQVINPRSQEHSSSNSTSSTTAINDSQASNSSPEFTGSTVATSTLPASPERELPAPPPLPPADFLASASKSLGRVRRSSRSASVPRELVDNWDKLFCEGLNGDVCVHTEDGGITVAHSFILAASSPVLRRLLQEQGKHHRKHIHVLGVPYDAARVFLRFLYSSRYETSEMDKYVLHLLALSHSYSIPLLKRTCTEEMERGLLTTENVVDLLQLARLCDASRLNFLCLRLVINNFKTVVRSEGWRVMRESDQALEQELVGHVIEADARKQEKLRKFEENKVYKQLHDAMEALVHICRDGCRTIGPHDRPSDGAKSNFTSSSSCSFPACKGLESLVRHFAACRTKVSGGCLHCKRMWELLELHSRMCDFDAERCKVPLCRHFRDRIGQQTKKEESRWNLLVNKVKAAKGASTGFSLAAVSATLENEAYK